MKSLMTLCRNWGERGCHPDVIEWKLPSLGGEIRIMSSGPELDRRDEICKNCEERFFINDEEKCPVCDSQDVERTGEPPEIQGKETAHGFKCNNCEENFWIYEQNLTS